jgi:anaerobic dimethyl sulfoxide reductase subunit B (iron-sulfur subunit)
MTYAFSFDARFCSGCKACQAACKDKNNLPTGVLWRRVIEVSGGEWQENGESWNNSVFAYNLSISCNHCAYPKCAGVCPTKAYTIREDGIVFLDTTKCIGCGYCAWACPYGAPQYDATAGRMTKCNSCLDYLERGLSPACVAACPLRVLQYGDMETIATGIPLWDTPSDRHPFPLAIFSHTQPRLAVTPHPAMFSTEVKHIANREEIQPQRSSLRHELPLLAFTLLAQFAVGGFWAMTWMFPVLWLLVEHDTTMLRLLPSAILGMSLGASILASFTHLGTKKNAWRVFSNLRKSRLSREILFLTLFAGSWSVTTFESVIRYRDAYEWIAITGIFGVGLIYNMSEVYRLSAAPGWNTWRTNAGFMLSAFLLGISSMTSVFAYESNLTSVHVPVSRWILIGGSTLVLLVIQLMITLGHDSLRKVNFVRIALLLAGIVISALGLLLSYWHVTWFVFVLFLITVSEECIGRWEFYRSRLGNENSKPELVIR